MNTRKLRREDPNISARKKKNNTATWLWDKKKKNKNKAIYNLYKILRHIDLVRFD